MVGSQVAHRHTWYWRCNWEFCSQICRQRKRETWSFETSELAPSDTLPSTSPHLLILSNKTLPCNSVLKSMSLRGQFHQTTAPTHLQLCQMKHSFSLRLRQLSLNSWSSPWQMSLSPSISNINWYFTFTASYSGLLGLHTRTLTRLYSSCYQLYSLTLSILGFSCLWNYHVFGTQWFL